METTIIFEQDIINLIRQEKPEISDTDLKWKLFHYCKDNELKNIGSQRYAKGSSIYNYSLSSEAENICQRIKAEYPEIQIAVWESRILNEWLNLLLAKNTIFIEVEKEFLETIYDALFDRYENTMILINPSINDYYRYLKDGLIVLKPLVMRAPVSKEGHVTLEKLFVDLICNKLLIEMFDQYAIEDLIRNASQAYAINEKKMLAYARRRGRYDKVKLYWRTINDRQADI